MRKCLLASATTRPGTRRLTRACRQPNASSRNCPPASPLPMSANCSPMRPPPSWKNFPSTNSWLIPLPTRASADQVKVQRLDSFVSLALQAERERGQGRTPAEGPAQLLARAVTGWLQGKDSTDPKFEAAERLWKARLFILEYQKTPLGRQKLLRSYEGQRSQAWLPMKWPA